MRYKKNVILSKHSLEREYFDSGCDSDILSIGL